MNFRLRIHAIAATVFTQISIFIGNIEARFYILFAHNFSLNDGVLASDSMAVKIVPD